MIVLNQSLVEGFIKLFHPILYKCDFYIKSKAFGILKAHTIDELILKYSKLINTMQHQIIVKAK